MEAVRITLIRTRRRGGAEEITHLGCTGSPAKWFTLDEVIAAIESGERFYVQSGPESLLLSVQQNGGKEKTLCVGFEPGPGRLLALPRG